MLAVARAAITRPALLLLDEVSMGLAPLIVEQLFQEIAHIASEGATVVVVEQFARTVLNIASWAAVMLGGRVIMNGSPDEIAKGLHTAYLGSTTEPSDAAKPTRDRR
jgi:branched-chain amino acid transport system ATP-binding protein